MRIRFTREGHRFVVTENSCRVYKRVDSWDGLLEYEYSTEFSVSPQKRIGMTKKYADEISLAKGIISTKHLINDAANTLGISIR